CLEIGRIFVELFAQAMREPQKWYHDPLQTDAKVSRRVDDSRVERIGIALERIEGIRIVAACKHVLVRKREKHFAYTPLSTAMQSRHPTLAGERTARGGSFV